jgi:voltage-gated potassium channel
VGLSGSGLYADARLIFNSVGIWDGVQKEYLNPADALNKLLSNEIGATFTNVIPDSILQYIDAKKLYIIPFTENYIANLQKTYPYFSSYLSNQAGLDVITLSVKSILVCNSNLDKYTIARITKIIFDNYNELVFPRDINKTKTKKNIIEGMSLQRWHPGTESFFKGIGFIYSGSIYRYLWILLFIPIAVILLLFITHWILYWQNKLNLKLISLSSGLFNTYNYLYVKLSEHKYITILFLLIDILLLNVFSIQFFEHQWAVRNNALSLFDARSFYDNLMWTFVYVGGGFIGEGFPKDPRSQFLVTLIPLISVAGFFSIIGLVTSDKIKNYILETKGLKATMLKNHIIICGWNKNVPEIIRNIHHEDRINKKQIVILANLGEDNPVLKYNFNKDMVAYVQGDAKNREDLNKANIKDADIAVIVSDDDEKNNGKDNGMNNGKDQGKDHDADNILKALTVENCCKHNDDDDYDDEKKKKTKGNDNDHIKRYRDEHNKKDIYTILELTDPRNYKLAKESFADDIISLGHIQSNLIVQAINNPGVSKLVEEIFAYGDRNEFYSIKVEEDLLIGMTYDQLLRALRDSENKILLLAINLDLPDDKIEKKKILDDNNIKNKDGMITNPKAEESKYKTRKGDTLIVLAEDERVIEKFKKNYKKDPEGWEKKESLFIQNNLSLNN